MCFLRRFFSILVQQHFSVILGGKQLEILITFANFNTSQCKQTHMCVGKVGKRPEDPFPRVCESVTYGKSRNIVNPKCRNIVGQLMCDIMDKYKVFCDSVLYKGKVG